MSPSLAKPERSSLCNLLEEVGPGAPTLCEGWTTLDLAAHLVVRERRPDSGPGLVIPALSGWTERVRQKAKQRGYERLIEQVRHGPPALSPFVLAEEAMNGTEYFIHHEDVRRAQGWGPRDLSVDVQDELWKRVVRGARMGMRKAPVGVVLQRPDGTNQVVKESDPSVVVSGEPAELLLFSSGRTGAARVELSGDQVAVEQLRAAKFGV